MKLYLAFILALISYIAASPITENVPAMSATHIVKSKAFFNLFIGIYYLLISYQIDDAQQPQMANLMDGPNGRVTVEKCKKTCRDIFILCTSRPKNPLAFLCLGAWGVCKLKCRGLKPIA